MKDFLSCTGILHERAEKTEHPANGYKKAALSARHLNKEIIIKEESGGP